MALDNFIAHIKQIGLITGSKFEVIIPIVDGNSNTAANTVSLMCNSVVLPGHSVMTNELRYYGEATERAYGTSYSPVTLTFYLDNDLSAKRFFDKWLSLVFNKETRELGYYDVYTRDMDIIVYNKAGTTIETIKLYEAYPKAVNDIQLDTSNNSPQILQVQMVYKWWSTTTADDGKGKTGNKQVPADEMATYGQDGLVTDSESLGNQTFNTPFGNSAETNPDLTFAGTDASTAFLQAGTNILTESTRSFTQAENLFDISSIASVTYPTANSLLAGVAGDMNKDFSSFANGISSLGSNVNGDISGAVTSMSSSLSKIAFDMGAYGNIVGTMGGNSAQFYTLASTMSQASTSMSTATQAKDMAGHLYSAAANLSASGSLITNTINQVNTTQGFDKAAEIAMKSTATTFTNSGAILNSATNFLTES